ncbi:hypothetical protein BGZ94_008959 [Podila epigama]|nr:hypothetical protein BGZ94_008959 [Podila epigama]
MSLRLSALHMATGRQSVRLARSRALFSSSSSSSYTRSRPTLTATQGKRIPSSFPTSSNSTLGQGHAKINRNNNINNSQYTSSRLQHQSHLTNRPQDPFNYNHQHSSSSSSSSSSSDPFPNAHAFAQRRAVWKAFIAGSITVAVTISLFNSLSESSSRSLPLRATFAHAPTPPSSSSSSTSSTESVPSQFAYTRFQKRVQMLSPEQVEARLAQYQQSFRITPPVNMVGQQSKEKKGKRTTILGYSINQIPSNNPIEDDLSRHVIRTKDGSIDKVFFGVYDGHGGWCCSQKVAQELAPSVAKELDKVKNPRDVMAVMEAIETGFLNLDDKIVNQTVKEVLAYPSRPLACSSLLPAIAGSCALMAYIDVQENDLYVACTGDSRAVLGVRVPAVATGKGGKEDGHAWKAVPLSFDQTGRNQWEVRRMKEEHPGEENTVIMRGRVLGGLEPTRAFGDSRYKWSKEIQEQVFQLFPSYRQPYRNFFTPPYVTAKPVVKHHKLGPEDRFLVMATDGLWDQLTSEEVIQLVGDLLDGKTGKERTLLDGDEINKIQEKLSAVKVAITGNKKDQQEEEKELTPAGLAPKGPTKQIRQFTLKEGVDVSNTLVRNALGGGDDDKLAATLSIPSPMSRVYRDDITVTVILFGEQDTKIPLSETAKDTDGFVEIP